jgi:hypothetical protein
MERANREPYRSQEGLNEIFIHVARDAVGDEKWGKSERAMDTK